MILNIYILNLYIFWILKNYYKSIDKLVKGILERESIDSNNLAAPSSLLEIPLLLNYFSKKIKQSDKIFKNYFVLF
jgi:hypothetical protein